MTESAMAEFDRNRPFRFFDLPREIRNEIYYWILYYDEKSSPDLGPKASRPKASLPRFYVRYNYYRRGKRNGYRGFVSLFTISRQFRDEALPVFWHGNGLGVNSIIDLASIAKLPERGRTALRSIGGLEKLYIYIAETSITIKCIAFVRKAEGTEKNDEYDTDLGIMIQRLLKIMPCLQKLTVFFRCTVAGEHYQGSEKTKAVLEKAARSLLEFPRPMQSLTRNSISGVSSSVYGFIVSRPIQAPDMQERRL